MKNKPSNSNLQEFIGKSEKPNKDTQDEMDIEIPQQPEFFKTPERFGTIPVNELPIGCDKKEQYRKIYPIIQLYPKVVEQISFGYKDLEPNRLILGDNLHVMRMLPPTSIDLIYIDPPFFSGRNYNFIFEDQNEIRSFNDIWEGGMPGYLTWLNARLLEMKRLLKSTGSICVHLDWHASHYVKVELDKIFGYNNFQNEIVWHYQTGGASKERFSRKHDIIFWYSKTKEYKFYWERIKIPRTEKAMARAKNPKGARIAVTDTEKIPNDVLIIQQMNPMAKERIGYPTQKPEELLEKFILSMSDEGDLVADFFCGGGTTPVVAQKLGRRWIACDISEIAIAVSRARLLGSPPGNKKTKSIQNKLIQTPDISIQQWGPSDIVS